ncbi:MAG: hypothetical protein IPH45_17950 [Bacteroidales bacterium]|nr:hypothetical protein [Bacteroidales bacterium]
MKKQILLFTIASVLAFSALAQTAEDKPTIVAENMYILPKRGMEDKFEAAVLAHNKKYHPEGPHNADLEGKMVKWQDGMCLSSDLQPMLLWIQGLIRKTAMLMIGQRQLIH